MTGQFSVASVILVSILVCNLPNHTYLTVYPPDPASEM